MKDSLSTEIEFQNRNYFTPKIESSTNNPFETYPEHLNGLREGLPQG